MYALFSQQKLVYQGLLASAQSELMNITHAHENLAMRSSNLKSTLASLQELYGSKKSDLYDQLGTSMSDTDFKILTGQEDGSKATGHKKKTKDGEATSFYSKYEWLCITYSLCEADNVNSLPESFEEDTLRSQYGLCTRQDIEDALKKIEEQLDLEEAKINKKIDETALKETRLDTEKASIETKITDYQKQLEKIEEAEGKGIEASIGKFQGVG